MILSFSHTTELKQSQFGRIFTIFMKNVKIKCKENEIALSARRASLASQGEGAYCERSRAKRGELAELASLLKARELIAR